MKYAIRLTLCFFLLSTTVQAAVIWSGNVVPNSPTTWTSSQRGSVGYSSYGSMDIDGGSIVYSYTGDVGYYYGSQGEVTVDGAGSAWYCSHFFLVGNLSGSRGRVDITNGGAITCAKDCYIGCKSSTIGEVTVDGLGSVLIAGTLFRVGSTGTGTLVVTNGGVVSGATGSIGCAAGSQGEVTISGDGSTWNCEGSFDIGSSGVGVLNIVDEGVVDIGGGLYMGSYGVINMSTGGMLALAGEGDDSLDDFMDLVDGSDAIRYWDDSTNDWADISGAVENTDYTLDYMTEGDLAGYTVLTVGAVPEPSVIALFMSAIVGFCVLRRRSGREE